MKKIVLPSLLALGLSFGTQAQKLNPTEQKIAQYIDAHFAQTEQLLKDAVNVNSGTLNTTGVKQVGDLFKKEFEKIGFATTWVNLPDSLKRAGHLVAEKKGKAGKKLFLIGHLDTVFEKEMTFAPYTYLNDSTITGQGVNDMKGGDVVVIAALQALQAQKLLDNATITAYFTGDEESAGKPTSVSRKDFIDRAKTHDVALAFETAVGLHTVATARRGASGWSLKTYGKTGHSSRVFSPEMGYGSIYEAARILNEFREQLSSEKYLTFNPGMILGGAEIKYNEGKANGSAVGKTNIISPETVVNGDLRFLTETQKNKAREVMKAIVAKNLTETKAEISFTDGIPAMEPTAANEQILAQLNQVSKDLGYGEVKAGDPGSRGAGDISYVAEYVACLDGLGASGKGAHAPGETLNIKELPALIKRTAILIYRLTR